MNWPNWLKWFHRVSCRNPSVRGLQSAHRGPLYPQSAGSPLAQQVPEMQRLPGATGGEVLQQGRQRLLQGGFLQVSSFKNKQTKKKNISRPFQIFLDNIFVNLSAWNHNQTWNDVFKKPAWIDRNRLHFPKGDSGPNAQPVSRGYRPHRWWGERRTSSITCTVLPASCARGSWPQVTSTIWWRTAGWSVRRTTRPPSREVTTN